jgi:parallel beta-helix repeat protein
MRRLGSEPGPRGHAGAGWRSRSRPVTATGRRHGRNGLKPELLFLEDRWLLSTFTVTSKADDGSSNTLRWAVAQANAATTASSIEIELGSSAATITLTQGQLELTNTKGAIAIYDGSGQGPVTISGNGVSRVLQIDSQVEATITGLTIASGSANGNGGGVYNAGGATLELQDCTIESSSATGMGGGLDSNGMATLTECTISGNKSNGYGGGIENSLYSSKTAAMTLTDCMISGNYSPSGSAGLNNNGTVALTNCTLSGNTSGRSGSGMSTNNGWAELTGCTISNNTATDSGGGFASWGGTAPSELTDCTISGNTTPGAGGALDDMSETVYLTNCTLSDNTSQNRGGGVSIEGGATVDLTDCTLSSNTTPGPGGGVYNGGMATLTDTIVAGNSSGTGDDIDGDTVTGSYNLVGTDSAGLVNGQNGNLVGVSHPVLSTLGNYGGQTETMALLPGSPAIGAGTLVNGITSDQRGEPLDSPNPDIGAFQSQGFTLAPVVGSTPQSTTDETAFPNPLAVTVTAKNSVEPVAGGVVAFAAPSDGASAQLSATAATIGSNGVASVNATANATAGSYPVSASATGVGSLDFDLTNNLIPLRFSGVTDQSITYGTPSVTITGTLADGSRVPQGETVAVMLNGIQRSAAINSNGGFSTTFNTSSLAASGLPHTVSYAYTSDGNFASANDLSTLTVTQATPTMTWQNPAPIVYGTALGANQLDATASVPGTFTYTPSAGTVLTAGSGQTLSVSFTPTDTTDDTTATATATINVEKATPSITWANPADIIYGTAMSSTQLDATASWAVNGSNQTVAGTFEYNPVAGEVLSVGNNQTLTVSFTPSDTTDYNATSATATLNVDKATPSITWANLADITYGTALSSTQLDATASVPGTFTYTPAAGTVLHAGNGQTLSVSFTPTDTTDYTTAAATATMNVDKATPSITWANLADITYGTALSSAQLDATASVPGTFTYTPSAGTVLTAGSGQTLSVSFTPTDTTDDTTAAATATINVDKATLTLNVSAPGGVYNGTPFPASVTIDGTSNSPATGLEGVTPILTYYVGSSTSGMSLGSTPPTHAGTYTVVASFAGNTDYAATQPSPETFTIGRGRATITLTSSGGSAVFGQSVTYVATVNTASTPGGTVTFSDGATPLATIPLGGSGQATLAITSLAPGSHAITATYSGDADILGVQSSATALSVDPDGTRVVLVPQAIFKKKKAVSVSLKAEIEPISPGGGIPTGVVTFELTKKTRKKLKVTTLGTIAINGGAATLTKKPNQLLKKAITIVYSGNEDFLASRLIPPALTKKHLKSLAQPSS